MDFDSRHPHPTGAPLFHPAALEEVVAAAAAWQGAPRGADHTPEQLRTASGFPVEPLYTPQHVPDTRYLRDLGFPGQEPYVRGIHPDMYRGRSWTHRQLAGFGPAEEANKRIRFLLDAGATGVNCVFDYPTLRGYDSDAPLARADAGRGGVAIDTVEDMGALFEGIPLGELSASLVTCQPICNVAVQSMYFAEARRRGLDLNELRGTSQNDFLMETVVATAPEVLPPAASFRLSCDAIEFATRSARRWNPISFAGYNYREAGCTAVQEIALVLANALACCEELLGRGLAVDAFAPRLSFFLSAQSDLFEEVAKYRAARRLWSRLVKERFRPQDPRSQRLRFHVQTAGVALTAQQPLNNVARAAYHALAAVLGGAQSVHVDGYDEALCNPTEAAALTALRTQQILQLETGVTRTVDPLGGAYFVESLTLQLEQAMVEVLDQIEAQGGIVAAVENGWVHRTIADAAYRHQQGVETGELPLVGVNCFAVDEEVYPVEFFQVPETVGVQEQKLRRIRAERSSTEVGRYLDTLARGAEGGTNLMAVALEAVTARCTEGEVAAVLRDSFGPWQQPLF